MKVAPHLAGSKVSQKSTSLCPSALQESLLLGNLVLSTQTSLTSSWLWLELWEFPAGVIQGQWMWLGGRAPFGDPSSQGTVPFLMFPH